MQNIAAVLVAPSSLLVQWEATDASIAFFNIRLRTSDGIAVFRDNNTSRVPGQSQATVYTFNDKEMSKLSGEGVEVRVTPAVEASGAALLGPARTVTFSAFGQAPRLAAVALVDAGGAPGASTAPKRLELSFPATGIDCDALQGNSPRLVLYARGRVAPAGRAVLAADIRACNATPEGQVQPVTVFTANISAALHTMFLDGAVAVAASVAAAEALPAEPGLLLAGSAGVTLLYSQSALDFEVLTLRALEATALVLRIQLAPSPAMAHIDSAVHTYTLRNAATGAPVANGSLEVQQHRLEQPLAVVLGGLDAAVAYSAEVTVTFDGPVPELNGSAGPTRPLPLPPAPVEDLRAVNVTARSATLRWAHMPSDVETQYALQLRQDGQGIVLDTVVAALRAELEQLAPLTTYTATVRRGWRTRVGGGEEGGRWLFCWPRDKEAPRDTGRALRWRFLTSCRPLVDPRNVRYRRKVHARIASRPAGTSRFRRPRARQSPLPISPPSKNCSASPSPGRSRRATPASPTCRSSPLPVSTTRGRTRSACCPRTSGASWSWTCGPSSRCASPLWRATRPATSRQR